MVSSLTAVLAIGMSIAAGVLSNDPIIIASDQSTLNLSVADHQTTSGVAVNNGVAAYFQMTQDPGLWNIDPSAANFKVFKDANGNTTDMASRPLFDRFWVLPAGVPKDWQISMYDSVATSDGQVQNEFYIRIPAATASGTYNLKIRVRDNSTNRIATFPLTVVIG